MPDPGIYITFFNEGEPFDRELPPVGPLVHVVLRHKDLVAERLVVQQPEDLSLSIDRWLEAELEYQRATGEEPGGLRRANMRVTAPDGVFLRFATFGDAREARPMPEIGPFAVVFIGRRSIEADGKILATRQASELAPWDLTSAAGDAHAGTHKPDIAFRAVGMAYHPSVGPGPRRPQAPLVAPAPPPPAEPAIAPTAIPQPTAAPPATAPPTEAPPVAAPAAQTPAVPSATYAPPARPAQAPPPPTYTPPAPAYTPPSTAAAPAPPPSEAQAAAPTLTARDIELIQRIERERAEDVLRARLQEEERRRLGVDESAEAASTWAMRYRPAAPEEVAAEAGPAFAFDFGALLWRMRFALIGLLLLGVGVYGFTVVRTGVAPGAQSQVRTVGIAERVSGQRWDYVVNSVQRIQAAGKAKPRGVFVVVRVGVANRIGSPAQISPGEFGLIDSAGLQYSPESTQSDVYSNPQNTTQFTWPGTVSADRTVTVPLLFDVDPAAKGLRLTIAELPNVRVRLE